MIFVDILFLMDESNILVIGRHVFIVVVVAISHVAACYGENLVVMLCFSVVLSYTNLCIYSLCKYFLMINKQGCGNPVTETLLGNSHDRDQNKSWSIIVDSRVDISH